MSFAVRWGLQDRQRFYDDGDGDVDDDDGDDDGDDLQLCGVTD